MALGQGEPYRARLQRSASAFTALRYLSCRSDLLAHQTNDYDAMGQCAVRSLTLSPNSPGDEGLKVKKGVWLLKPHFSTIVRAWTCEQVRSTRQLRASGPVAACIGAWDQA